jgi:hypothetical protein
MIAIEKIEPIEDAFVRLRAAPLDAAGDEQVFIYKDAGMRLADLAPEEANPSSLYVLKPQLALLRDMRKELLDRYGIDILHLSSVLHLKTADGQVLGMAPPFVEVYEETVNIVPRPGDQHPPNALSIRIPIFKDGMHRAWIAREEGETVRCIVVSGALKTHLPYAYPNAWSQVKEYNSKEERETKKFFRRQEPYTFLRPLRALRQTGEALPAPEYNSNYR